MKYYLILVLMFMNGLHAFPQDNSAMLEKALPAVVTIALYKIEETKKIYGFRGAEDLAYNRQLDLAGAKATGSGFVVDYQGKKYILTNAHVIESASDSAESIFAFSINQTKYPVKVKGGDSFYDFAVLEFVNEPGDEISALHLAEDDSRVGQPVYAIGNPLGEYPYSVSNGIISAKNRVRQGITGRYGFLQSTATVIWGNSGGPLLNTSGEVAGMNSQIAFATHGNDQIWQPQINFALEAQICRRLLDDIINNNGKVHRAFLGLEVSQTYLKTYSYLSDDATYALLDKLPVISSIADNSPASRTLAGCTGWFVSAVNDKPVRNVEEVWAEFENIRPGSEAVLTLIDSNQNTKNKRIQTLDINDEILNALARYVVDNDPYITVEEKDGDILVSNKPDAQSLVDRTRNTTKPKEKFKVLAAGIVKNKDSELWKIQSISDLGTAFRLQGYLGFCDLIVKPRSDKNAKASSLRLFFSGDENKLRQTIWY